MDEGMAMVICAPFYASAYVMLFFAVAYGWHMMRRIDQSATETQTTESIVPGK